MRAKRPWLVARLRDHRESLLRHFLELDGKDRRLRFGASIPDASVRAYVERIDLLQDAVFAVCGPGSELVGAAHLARSGAQAEIGLSVLPGWRRRGVGSAVLSRAVRTARSSGAESVVLQCLPENGSMMALARKHGLHIVNEDGAVYGWPDVPASVEVLDVGGDRGGNAR